MTAPRYILVADDLTGANDTGVQLLNYGLAATVTIEDDASAPVPVFGGDGVQAMALDTESRNIDAADAAVRVARVAEGLRPFTGTSIFYKKVDSTMRGNLAAEVTALAKGLGLRTIVFTPAFPRNGRTVLNGILYLDGLPVSETAMSRDPFKPVLTSRLAEIMAVPGEPAPIELRLPEIRFGHFPQQVEGCFCADAESHTDMVALIKLVQAALPLQQVLWVGSAGLAGALLECNGEKPEPLPAPPRPDDPRPALLLVGSVHPKNREQVSRLVATNEADLLRIEPVPLLDATTNELARLVREGTAILKQGRNLLLVTSQSEADIQAGSSHLIARHVGELTRDLLRQNLVRGFYVTGGDMAVHVLRALNCHTARIEQEVELGVPLIRLLGGECPELAVITKAGAFGNSETLCHALHVL